MSKHTVSASGVAIPAEGRRTRRSVLPGGVALAIAAQRAAQAKVDGMEGHHSDEGAFSAAVDAAWAASSALAETPCVSDAEFFAKASYLVKSERRLWESVPSDAIPFGLVALATERHARARARSPADPIFAAIERHKAAAKAFSAVCKQTDEADVDQGGDPGWITANAAEVKALKEVLETAPTTIAGMRAVLEYVARFDKIMVGETSTQLLLTLLESPVLTA